MMFVKNYQPWLLGFCYHCLSCCIFRAMLIVCFTYNYKCSLSCVHVVCWVIEIMCSGGVEIDRRRTGGIGLDYEIGKIDDVDGHSGSNKHMLLAHNRNLIEYFARICQSQDPCECIDLEYIASLLNSGANINCTDKYGQSVFHEVRIMVCGWCL